MVRVASSAPALTFDARFPGWRSHAADGSLLWVDVHAQRLWRLVGFRAVDGMRCSTARAGLGEREGSLRTPRGWHAIGDRIGGHLPTGAVLKSREWTGGRWPVETAAADEDLVLSRVLWLDGLEPGRNRGGAVDSHDRFIYIHGTNHPERLGSEASHGCVRVACADVVRLHDLVAVGHPVWIG